MEKKITAKPLAETIDFKPGDRIRYTDPRHDAAMVGTVVDVEKGSESGDYVQTDWMSVKWDATGKTEVIHFTSPKLDTMEVVAAFNPDKDYDEGKVPCDMCNGLGEVHYEDGIEKCRTCAGTGKQNDMGMHEGLARLGLKSSAPYKAQTPPPAKAYKDGDKFFPREGLYPSGKPAKVKDLAKPGAKKTEVAKPKKVEGEKMDKPVFKSAKTYAIAAAEVSAQDKAAIDKLFTRPAGISDEEWFDRVYNIHFDIEDVEMDLPKRAESYIDEKTAQAIHAFTPEQAMNIYTSRGYDKMRETSKNPIVDEMLQWMLQTYRSGKPLNITSEGKPAEKVSCTDEKCGGRGWRLYKSGEGEVWDTCEECNPGAKRVPHNPPMNVKSAKVKAVSEEGSDEHLMVWDAVCETFKVEHDDITVTPDDLNHGYTVEGLPDGDIFVYVSSEDAEYAALDRVREDLKNDPELFSQDWLKQHLFMSPTDARIMAGELADSYVEDMEADFAVKEAHLQPEYDAAEEAGDEESMEAIVEQAKEALRDAYDDEVEKALLNDPVGYLVDEQGLYESVEALIEAGLVRVDIEEAAKDAVDTDGAGHFLSSEDGELHELSNGMPYVRV